jgi:hypothetical protein
MKYIFMAGAPGSKWSSVSKNIYFSPSIDRSDASPDREYYHDAPGTMQLMHMGAYFDPGMEFNLPADLNTLTKSELEIIFDSAFSGEGVRIIKSHIFADHINLLKDLWPDCPVILVHRDDDACLGWWVKCGHFDITYPKYDKYYVDLKRMSFIINRQNLGITESWHKYTGKIPPNNQALAHILGIKPPPEEYFQDYNLSNIGVKVI